MEEGLLHCFEHCSVHLSYWQIFQSCSDLKCQSVFHWHVLHLDKLKLLNRKRNKKKKLLLTSSALKKGAVLYPCVTHSFRKLENLSCCLATHNNVRGSYSSMGTKKAHPCLLSSVILDWETLMLNWIGVVRGAGMEFCRKWCYQGFLSLWRTLSKIHIISKQFIAELQCMFM